jgi:hypothetical protein
MNSDGLVLGVEIERRVLAEGGTHKDIALVYEQQPDLLDSFADEIILGAKAVRDDQGCFSLGNDEVVIYMPALARPTLEEIQKRFSSVQRIGRDDSPTEEVTLRLATVLKPKESSINHRTYERRLVPLRDIVNYETPFLGKIKVY